MNSEMDADSAVFELERDRFVPTGLARGPWYPNSQHGSAMLGLLARAIEKHESAERFQTTRLTVDLMRAAPMAAVEVPTEVIRSGKNTDLIQAHIIRDGITYARATALRFRVQEIDTTEEPPRYGSGRGYVLPRGDEVHALPAFEQIDVEAFHQALEMRPPLGSELPAMWFRMRCPLVAGESLGSLVRTAIISDWTYSIPIMHRIFGDPAHREENRSFSAINPDTSVNLFRPMEGEWLCLESQTHYGELGAGIALAHLHDSRGAIGHSSQSILMRGADRRPPTLEELAKKQEAERAEP